MYTKQIQPKLDTSENRRCILTSGRKFGWEPLDGPKLEPRRSNNPEILILWNISVVSLDMKIIIITRTFIFSIVPICTEDIILAVDRQKLVIF